MRASCGLMQAARAAAVWLGLAAARLGQAAVWLVLAVAAVPMIAGAADGSPLDSSRFVAVGELRVGDRCVGRTVFSGDRVEEFDVEILGVVRGTAPGSDLIIARASGGPLEEAGIVEGMSGSPVYRDGRLVGAISSSWAFAKQPIAGITPIGEMLPALDLFPEDGAGDVPGDGASGEGSGGALGALVVPEGERASSRAVWLLGASGVPRGEARGLVGTGPVAAFGREMREISLPLVVSGASERFLGRLASALSEFGLSPVRGAAVGAGGSAPDLEPGSAVGIQLVRGDANWTAVGTVTLRDEDRILAFGHPLFQAGDIELPMVGAFVHAVMPLQSMSFKYASGSDLVGTMVQDRRRMIAGRVGSPPPMTALTVSVRGGEREARTFDFEVVRARPYASFFAGLAAAGAIDEVVGTAGPSLVHIAAIVSTDAGDLSYSDVFQAEDPSFRAGGELAALMDLVLANQFERRLISRVKLDVHVLESESWSEIERIDTGRVRYEPGEEVAVAVTLRNWRGGRLTERMRLPIPDSVPDGRLLIRVSGAGEYRESERERLGEGLRPRDYEQLASLIDRSKPGNTVIAQLLSESPGISLSGRELRSPPGRASLAMARSGIGGAVDRAERSVVAEVEVAHDREVRGARELTITVTRDR